MQPSLLSCWSSNTFKEGQSTQVDPSVLGLSMEIIYLSLMAHNIFCLVVLSLPTNQSLTLSIFTRHIYGTCLPIVLPSKLSGSAPSDYFPPPVS